jgi:hypothetical protein
MDPPRNQLLKRALTDSSPILLTFQLLSKCSVPWFEDGNIILETEQTQFRVYRGILSRYSVVFKDMFDLSGPDGEGDVEGCPVVHLSDNAEELQHVLNALHRSTRYGSVYLTMNKLFRLHITC